MSDGALVCNTTRAAAGEAVVEVSNNGREYTSDAASVQLVSLRVLDVQPWSGPQEGATVVSVRGRGTLAGGLMCQFGESSPVGAWSSGASRVRCVSSASGVDGGYR